MGDCWMMDLRYRLPTAVQQIRSICMLVCAGVSVYTETDDRVFKDEGLASYILSVYITAQAVVISMYESVNSLADDKYRNKLSIGCEQRNARVRERFRAR